MLTSKKVHWQYTVYGKMDMEKEKLNSAMKDVYYDQIGSDTSVKVVSIALLLIIMLVILPCSMSFHESYLLKMICLFSKLEHLLPKARNQLWWKLSVQLKHHGRMENIKGKITIAIFLQLAQVVLYSLLLVYNLSHNQCIITDMVTRWSLINGVVIMVAGVCQVVALRSIFKTKPPTTKTQLRA